MGTNPQFNYRPDIDGLRSIAVLSVIFYHAFPAWLPGGFVGVDVFFVISGFLITGILLKEVESSEFSIKSFYIRRIKRLFPALVFMFLVVLFIGWLVLLPHELRQLGKHTVGGAGFIANLVFWSETGYFDASSELKPLLHLWSLGVEEQFYFFWPLVIACAFKFRWNFGLCAMVLLLISFMANINLVYESPSSAFFLPHARFWELIAGGLLAYLSFRGALTSGSEASLPHQIMSSAGIILVLTAIVLINKSYSFPGWAAIAPVIGSMLMIAGGPKTWVGRVVLSNKLMVSVGLVSYPLYLWHWPLFSFAHIIYADYPPVAVTAGLIALTFLLALFTNRCIELPLKKASRHKENSSKIIAGLIVAMGLTLLIGALYFLQIAGGRLAHLKPLSDAHSDWRYEGDKASSISGVIDGAVLFFGDSFTRQYAPRVARIKESDHLHRPVDFHTAAGCVPIRTLARRTYPECAEYTDAGFERAASDQYEAIVFSSSWLGMLYRGDYYRKKDSDKKPLDLFNEAELDKVFDDFEQDLKYLLSKQKIIHIVLHPPGGLIAAPGYYPNRFSAKPELVAKTITTKEHLERTNIVNSRLTAIGNRLGIPLTNPADWLCKDGICSFSDKDKKPLFKDATHLRNEYVRCCVTAFDDIIIPRNGS